MAGEASSEESDNRHETDSRDGEATDEGSTSEEDTGKNKKLLKKKERNALAKCKDT